MDDAEILTEAEAAALIGWTAANLRSHRLRHEAERLAQGMTPRDAHVVLAVRERGATQEPRVRDYRGPALFRERGGRWSLSQHGLEVARRLGGVTRRSPAPPPSVLVQGRVRYRRADVLAWLDAHPQVADQAKVHGRTWSYQETAGALGLEVSTLRTAVSRAQVARRKLDAGAPDPHGHLVHQITRVPPWTWAGAERRWIPQQVRAWLDRHRSVRDPLAVEHDPARGRLISEAAARRLAGVSWDTIRGYRARARAALRRLQDAGTSEDVTKARAWPPYVVRQDGSRWYHEADVRAWVAARGTRG